MSEDEYNLKFGRGAGADVDAYLEYRRIVGDDDGGKIFTPEEYEDYKKRVLPQRSKNRLYVSWSGPSGMDCKLIGPETPCFCTHRYKQHKTDFAEIPKERPIKVKCRAKGCLCATFYFVPLNGAQPIRCSCKHYADEHKESGALTCRKANCKCPGFRSSFTCSCGEPCHAHRMIVETREEREARGLPVGLSDVPYQAMGGITGFSSLADGYLRMDPSGAGPPSKEFLDMSISSSDHPFLRANARSIHASNQMRGVPDNAGDIAEMNSQMRKPGESELDFYERRYNERQKQSKVYKGPPRKAVGQPRK